MAHEAPWGPEHQDVSIGSPSASEWSRPETTLVSLCQPANVQGTSSPCRHVSFLFTPSRALPWPGHPASKSSSTARNEMPPSAGPRGWWGGSLGASGGADTVRVPRTTRVLSEELLGWNPIHSWHNFLSPGERGLGRGIKMRLLQTSWTSTRCCKITF